MGTKRPFLRLVAPCLVAAAAVSSAPEPRAAVGIVAPISAFRALPQLERVLPLTFPTRTSQFDSSSPQLEQRDQPVTADDLSILVRAERLLEDEAAWNRQDDRECADDERTGRRSLFCPLQRACIDVLGKYDHRRVALEEVRFAVEDATRGRAFEHRLRDFNNLPETRLSDIRRVLLVAKQRVAARLRGRA
jgi:hypothetical protein